VSAMSNSDACWQLLALIRGRLLTPDRYVGTIALLNSATMFLLAATACCSQLVVSLRFRMGGASAEGRKEEARMKIAVVTDDGTTVSRHFGRARYYTVFSVEEQRVLGRQMLDRSDTLQPVDEHEALHGLAGQIDCHGTGTAAAAAHLRMVQPIEDCEALVARGMSVCWMLASVRS
jgi:hypothetical protein